MSPRNIRLQIGDHLVVKRLLYDHHGIYSGNGNVIHYESTTGSKLLGEGIVQETSIEEFANGDQVYIQKYKKSLPPITVLQRARSKIGERKYSVWSNNCEHFALWAKIGQAKSSQVDEMKTAGMVAGGVLSVVVIAVTFLGNREERFQKN